MIHTVNALSWAEPFSKDQCEKAIQSLENGGVIYFPNLGFERTASENVYLTPSCLKPRVKNISFDPNQFQLKGLQKEYGLKPLEDMMARFFSNSKQLLETLIPHYQSRLMTGRTSFRPAEIAGRTSSIRKDDTRLHVDAFPATPNQGKRILRVFTNINPNGKTRDWHLGEPFEQVVKRFLSTLRPPRIGSRCLLSLLGITKSYRTLYDHYMLSLHNAMKENEQYQREVSKLAIQFPPNSTWITMTDQVSHAALSGQYLLEQTFYLPVSNMQNPDLSPLNILELYLNKKLA